MWHGGADRTVDPANADEIIKQWLDVHQLPSAPMAEDTVDGYPHQIWWNADGETVVESYTITNMAHGTPLGTAENDERYGMQGAFLIEAGISSSYHIVKFFGLTKWIRESQEIDYRASGKADPGQVATGAPPRHRRRCRYLSRPNRGRSKKIIGAQPKRNASTSVQVVECDCR